MANGGEKPTDERRIVAWAIALAMVLIACKTALLPWPSLGAGSIARWLVRLALVSARDVAFCLVFAAIFLAAAKVFGPPKNGRRWYARRTIWIAVGLAAHLAALWGIVSVPIFAYLNVQLTWPLLTFIGGWREMAESAWSRVGTIEIVALALAPLCFHGAYRLILRANPWTRFSRGRFRPQVALISLAAGVLFACLWTESHWRERSQWQYRVCRNAHWQFAKSAWDAWRSDSLTIDPLDRDSLDASEFVPLAPASQVAQLVTAGRPKNVVLLVLESVGAEYLQLYGAPYDNTPELHSLADHSLVFDSIYAQCPSSAKALVAILTATYPRLDTHEQTRDDRPLPSLAQTLSSAGARTAFVHSGDWSWRGGDDFLRSHGFEFFQDARDLEHDGASWGTDDGWLADRVFRWIDSGKGPFFAMAWTIQTHHPYRARDNSRDHGVSDPELRRYLNAIREADALVGRFWREIERRGLASETLLVVVGDHGQAFGQHDQRLHTFGVFEENVHVPLVIVHDGRILPVGRRGVVGQQIDIGPTIAEAMGLAPERDWQGRSLLSPDHPSRAYFYALWDPLVIGTRENNEKFLWYPNGENLLFDLVADRAELVNRIESRPESAQRLWQRTKSLVAFQSEWLARPRAELALRDRSGGAIK